MTLQQQQQRRAEPMDKQIKKQAIVDFLRRNNAYDYSAADINNNVKCISFKTVVVYLNEMLSEGTVIRTRYCNTRIMWQTPSFISGHTARAQQRIGLSKLDQARGLPDIINNTEVVSIR